MKISVSLTESDLVALDEYAAQTGLASRSAAVQHAVRLLGASKLGDEYAAAWAEWDASGDAELWEQAVGDGLADAPR